MSVYMCVSLMVFILSREYANSCLEEAETKAKMAALHVCIDIHIYVYICVDICVSTHKHIFM